MAALGTIFIFMQNDDDDAARELELHFFDVNYTSSVVCCAQSIIYQPAR